MQAGCTLSDDFIKIQKCKAEVGGGFRAPDGVILCHNHLASQEEVNHALTHELIHAYDHCRAKDLDWCNCAHHACSEIRAASLSGDCNYKMEVLRGNFGLAGQHQKCVKRRAELSVRMNPWMPLAREKAIPISTDWVVTMVTPVEKVQELYEKEVVNDGQETDQVDHLDDEGDVGLTD